MFRWRIGFLAIALACGSIVAFSLYLQHSEFSNPCPLCILQRVGFCLCGLVALLAVLFPFSRFNWFWPSILSLIAFAGAGIAFRHMMIQFYLDQDHLPSCGAGIVFMLQNYPIFDVLKSALYGTGECTVVDRFLNIPIPVLSFLWFLIILITAWGTWYWQTKGTKGRNLLAC